jgi:hypothetical protein
VKSLIKQRGRTIYWGENDFRMHYFSPDFKVYSDKMAKLSLRCDENSGGKVIARLAACFDEIYVDEVKIWPVTILKFYKNCSSPPLKLPWSGSASGNLQHRQYRKNAKYKKAAIVNFFDDKAVGVTVDAKMLNENFRCFHEINDFANKLYPDIAPSISNVRSLSGHDGIFLL